MNDFHQNLIDQRDLVDDRDQRCQAYPVKVREDQGCDYAALDGDIIRMKGPGVAYVPVTKDVPIPRPGNGTNWAQVNPRDGQRGFYRLYSTVEEP